MSKTGSSEDLFTRYNIALTIFLLPYPLLEVLCKVNLKLTRLSIWMPSMALAWSIVMTCMGLFKDFKRLAFKQLFLRITSCSMTDDLKTGFFPVATFLLTI